MKDSPLAQICAMQDLIREAEKLAGGRLHLEAKLKHQGVALRLLMPPEVFRAVLRMNIKRLKQEAGGTVSSDSFKGFMKQALGIKP